MFKKCYKLINYKNNLFIYFKMRYPDDGNFFTQRLKVKENI